MIDDGANYDQTCRIDEDRTGARITHYIQHKEFLERSASASFLRFVHEILFNPFNTSWEAGSVVSFDFRSSSETDSLLILVDQAHIPMNNLRAVMGREMPALGAASGSYLDPSTMHM